jgi:hypothetical protein
MLSTTGLSSFSMDIWSGDMNLISTTLTADVNYNPEVILVSEPATVAIFGLGVVGLGFSQRRKLHQL